MPAPSRLKIATNAVDRLVNEESAYRREIKQQELRVTKAEATAKEDPENGEYIVKQERKALEETEAVFAPLHQRIELAVAQLQQQLLEEEDPAASAEEIIKAKEALSKAKALPQLVS